MATSELERLKELERESREAHGVEPICTELQIVRSTYYEHKSRQRHPERLPERTKRDQELEVEILRVWHEGFGVYGVRKVWRHLLGRALWWLVAQ